MKQKTVRLLSLALACLMCLVSVGCAKGGETSTITTLTSEITEDGVRTDGGSSSVQSTVSGSGTSSIPQKDQEQLHQAEKELSGYEFSIASTWITQEENLNENSPLMDRLFWEQAHKVEKEYGCKIKVVNLGPTRSDNLKTYIMAGKKVADLIDVSAYWMAQSVANKYFIPWSDVPGINVSDTSKWNASSLKTGLYNGKQYGLNFFKPTEARFCVMFNKTLLKKNGVDADSLYALVRNKQWTWDKLREYAMACTKDTNSDNINDTWGLIGKFDYIGNAALTSFGGGSIVKNGNKYVYGLNSNNSLAGLNYYYKLVNTDKCVWVADQLNTEHGYTSISENTYRERFTNGTSAFLIWESWVLNQYVKMSANFDYGILPIPLGTGQTEYKSPAYNDRLFCVTSTNKDLAKASVVINALAKNFGGYKGDEWYDDVAADYFKNDVKENVEMYKIVMNSHTVDYGLAITSLEQTVQDVIIQSVYMNKATPAAAADSYKNTYKDAINQVFNK